MLLSHVHFYNIILQSNTWKNIWNPIPKASMYLPRLIHGTQKKRRKYTGKKLNEFHWVSQHGAPFWCTSDDGESPVPSLWSTWLTAIFWPCQLAKKEEKGGTMSEWYLERRDRDDSYESTYNASGLSDSRNYRFGDANKLAWAIFINYTSRRPRLLCF